MENVFNFNEFKNGKKVVTKLGQAARFITESRGKMLVEVKSGFSSEVVKYNLDGRKYNYNTQYDLVMA